MLAAGEDGSPRRPQAIALAGLAGGDQDWLRLAYYLLHRLVLREDAVDHVVVGLVRLGLVGPGDLLRDEPGVVRFLELVGQRLFRVPAASEDHAVRVVDRHPHAAVAQAHPRAPVPAAGRIED